MIHSTCKFKAPHNSTTSLLGTTKSSRLSSSFWPGVEVSQIVQTSIFAATADAEKQTSDKCMSAGISYWID